MTHGGQKGATHLRCIIFYKEIHQEKSPSSEKSLKYSESHIVASTKNAEYQIVHTVESHTAPEQPAVLSTFDVNRLPRTKYSNRSYLEHAQRMCCGYAFW